MVDWGEVERRLGTSLPLDYRDFCEEFPALYFDSHITILHPGANSIHGNLLQKGCGILGEWQHIEKMPGLDLPYSIFPSSGGLLPWGYDDDNGQYFWRTEGALKDWTIVIFESFQWWEHAGGFFDFWSSLVLRKISPPVLPGGFPSKDYSVETFDELV
ncbi:hypothetical protein B1H26_13035 [Amycolatopsis sp. BJA-103]|nr:hypothetical protein B1H26_13035 [Amycolatopsis sp. BJA-103]